MIQRVLTFCAALALHHQAFALPFFTGLGDLPGGDFLSVPTRISADGSTVVGFSRISSNDVNPFFNLEAFRWTKDEGMFGLGHFPGHRTRSIANDVSADGSVVVGNSAGGPFRWTANEGLVNIVGTPPSLPTSADGVSADGSIVVGRAFSRRVNGLENREIYRWTTSGDYETISVVADSFRELPIAISADASTIVGASDTFGFFHRTEGGNVSSLGPLQDGELVDPRGISSDGSVVVGRSFTSDRSEAFRWSQREGMVGLGDLPGGRFASFSGANDASADGSVVVGFANVEGDQDGFRWTQNEGLRSITEILINDYDLDLSGWDILGVTSVSDDGQVFAGSGFNPDGEPEAWIADLRTGEPSIPDLTIPRPREHFDILENSVQQVQQAVTTLSPRLLIWREDPVTNDKAFLPVDQFDPRKDTYVLVHGWLGVGSSLDFIAEDISPLNDFYVPYANALTERAGEDINIVAYDWRDLATSTTFNPLTILGFAGAGACLAAERLCPSSLEDDLADYVFRNSGESDFWVPNSQVPERSADLTRLLKLAYINGGTSLNITSSEEFGSLQIIGHSLGGGIAGHTTANLMLQSVPPNSLRPRVDRLTLLDVPEDLQSLLVGGRVPLEPIVRQLSELTNVSIENYHMAYGTDYSRGLTASLNDPFPFNGLQHTETKTWYEGTINPQSAHEAWGRDPFTTSAVNRGFDVDIASINSDTTTALEFGRIGEPYDALGSVERIIDRILESIWVQPDYQGWLQAGSGSVNYLASLDALQLTTGSPVHAYVDLFVPDNALAFSLEFFPETWFSDDIFAIFLDDLLVFSLNSLHFENNWMFTGWLDLSPFRGNTATLTLSYLSDFPDAQISIRNIKMQTTAVPEPTNMMLISLGLAGMFILRRRTRRYR